MPITRSTYLAKNVATKGLSAVDPIGGAARALRGYIGEYPEGVEPDFGVPEVPALLSSLSVDSNGIQRLLSDDVQSMTYWPAGQDVFANPDKEFTGYSADGYWYTSGVLDPTHLPFKASWATEGEGDATQNRGTLDGFPARIIIVATRLEVAVFDADSLDVWMRLELATFAPAGKGKLGGGPGTIVRDVAYVNGFLLMATNEGLRIADFRQDRGMAYGDVTDIWLSASGLVDRNDDDYLDLGSISTTNRILISSDCLSLTANTFGYGKAVVGGADEVPTRSTMTVAAVGHSGGISAISLDLSFDSLPFVEVHPANVVIATGWEVEDDDGGDGISPYFIDHNFGATNWESKGVSLGDTLTTDIGSVHTIVGINQIVNGRRLTLSPMLSLTDTGSSYTIHRSIWSLLLEQDLSLFVADGNSIAVNRTQDWFRSKVAGSLTPLYGPVAGVAIVFRGDVSPLPIYPGQTNDIARRGELTYIATDIGVFSATNDGLSSGVVSRFLYSTEAVTEADADYKILEGTDKRAAAIAVDPETGNISVAVTDVSSVVTEINPNIEQAFRFFGSIGRIESLVSFRNPYGPPDVEVS